MCVTLTAGAVRQRDEVMAATEAKTFGVQAYRITSVNREGAIVNVHAELLDGSNAEVGKFALARHFRHPLPADLSDAADDDSTLTWHADVVEITTDYDAGRFTLRYNGTEVGVVSPGQRSPDNEKIEKFVATKGDLIKLSAAVGRDLDRLGLMK